MGLWEKRRQSKQTDKQQAAETSHSPQQPGWEKPTQPISIRQQTKSLKLQSLKFKSLKTKQNKDPSFVGKRAYILMARFLPSDLRQRRASTARLPYEHCPSPCTASPPTCLRQDQGRCRYCTTERLAPLQSCFVFTLLFPQRKIIIYHSRGLRFLSAFYAAGIL